MLKDSQHIGHSNSSSLLASEQASSSEHSQKTCLDTSEFFLDRMPAMAFDANFHILTEELFQFYRMFQKGRQKNCLNMPSTWHLQNRCSSMKEKLRSLPQRNSSSKLLEIQSKNIIHLSNNIFKDDILKTMVPF